MKYELKSLIQFQVDEHTFEKDKNDEYPPFEIEIPGENME